MEKAGRAKEKSGGAMIRELCTAVSGSGGLRMLFCGGYMAVCAVQDFRSRKISLRVSMTAGGAAVLLDAAAFACRSGEVFLSGSGKPSVFGSGMISISGNETSFLFNGGTVLSYMAGLIPGLLLLLLAFFADGAAGQGDGICFLVLGAFLGSPAVWIILMTALFLAALTGITLMVLRKAGRKTRLPFLTFTAAAWAGLTVASVTGIRL